MKNFTKALFPVTGPSSSYLPLTTTSLKKKLFFMHPKMEAACSDYLQTLRA